MPQLDQLSAQLDRLAAYLEAIDRSANGLALFACDGAGLFEAFQLAAPVASNRLCVSSQPHLYPVRDERIDHVVVSGEQQMVALLREQLPKDVDERIVDVLRLNVHASERAVVEATVAALQVGTAIERPRNRPPTI